MTTALSPVWDHSKKAMSTEDKDIPLLRAARQCFIAPSDASLGTLGALLGEEGQASMRDCVLVLQEANVLLDEEGRQLFAILAEQGQPLVCAPGCSECCSQLVLCQPFEAVAIKVFLQAHQEILRAFTEYYAAWDSASRDFRRSYLAWAQRCYAGGEDDGSHKLEDYQVPCPLLDSGGCCSIYPVRPYACRTCIAVDPACQKPLPGERAGLRNMHYSLHTGHHASRQSVIDLVLRKLGAEKSPVPMPEMVARSLGTAPSVLKVFSLRKK